MVKIMFVYMHREKTRMMHVTGLTLVITGWRDSRRFAFTTMIIDSHCKRISFKNRNQIETVLCI